MGETWLIEQAVDEVRVFVHDFDVGCTGLDPLAQVAP
ncbi:hypothetical protein SAMN05421507_101902 [Lentzea jiangxiensis]|uniref:Uncharacterized protein n=1 Tax=Lentzea jiangxiensis TaxID=641025 RepID=A0A1H0FSX4_9PSEU|nr:hypothetical protein SAMN05421507_101902 [Lentzea jiangxiensis]